MKEKLEQLLSQNNNSLRDEDIVAIQRLVCDMGDIMVIKADGQRVSHKYTIMIMSSEGKFKMIRHEGEGLSDSVMITTNKYLDSI